MPVRTKRALARFVIFAMMGLLLEVFFTAIIKGLAGDRNLHGMTSPWMMIDYGLLGLLLMPIARPMIRRKVPLPVRSIVYMVGIFAVEFLSGWVFDECGLKIWDYSAYRGNLYGYITPQFIPLWYALGLSAEFLYQRVDMVALALARGVSAEQLESLTTGRPST
jgi:uncharacterized membrane protein